MRKYFFISMILFSGCKSSNDIIVTWRSDSYSLWDRMSAILLNRSLWYGNTLELRPDSSWRLAGTCEIIEGCKWKIIEDSLLLFPDTGRGVKNNALDRKITDFNGVIFKYKIRKNCLESTATGHFMEIDRHGEMISRKVKILQKLEPYK